MGIQPRLVLTMCIVNLVVIPVKLLDQRIREAGLSNTHDERNLKEDFYKMFPCVVENNVQKYETYRDSWKDEIAEKQQAVNSVEERSPMTRNRNTYKKQNSIDHVSLVKREAPAVDQPTTRLWGSYKHNLTNRYREEENIDTEEEEEKAVNQRFSYGTTLNYPIKQDLEERADRSARAMYRKIVEGSINLFWGQQEQLSEMRVRERRIRKKTKPDLMGLSIIIEEAYDYMRRKLSLLGDKLCNPRYNHPDPLNVETVRFFENTWNKVENFLNNSLDLYDNVECEIGEIRIFIKRARRELPVRFEYLEKLMRNLRVAEVELHNFTTTEGTTKKEYALSLKSLRNNETKRASFQKK